MCCECTTRKAYEALLSFGGEKKKKKKKKKKIKEKKKNQPVTWFVA
jgi:hypothetical protein